MKAKRRLWPLGVPGFLGFVDNAGILTGNHGMPGLVDRDDRTGIGSST